MTQEITPEVVERMATFVRRMAVKAIDERYLGFEAATAREIVADLPEPVDPDLLIAREITADRYPGTATAAAILRGEFDSSTVALVLAGIKKGRALATGNAS